MNMKNLEKLNGSKILSKKEQQSIKGGSAKDGECRFDSDCEYPKVCRMGACVRDV